LNSYAPISTICRYEDLSRGYDIPHKLPQHTRLQRIYRPYQRFMYIHHHTHTISPSRVPTLHIWYPNITVHYDITISVPSDFGLLSHYISVMNIHGNDPSQTDAFRELPSREEISHFYSTRKSRAAGQSLLLHGLKLSRRASDQVVAARLMLRIFRFVVS